ncbi:hypothetical protein ACFQ10_07275 [Streptomyces indonesiensis]
MRILPASSVRRAERRSRAVSPGVALMTMSVVAAVVRWSVWRIAGTAPVSSAGVSWAAAGGRG